jgi:hypothetical protein
MNVEPRLASAGITTARRDVVIWLAAIALGLGLFPFEAAGHEAPATFGNSPVAPALLFATPGANYQHPGQVVLWVTLLFGSAIVLKGCTIPHRRSLSQLIMESWFMAVLYIGALLIMLFRFSF